MLFVGSLWFSWGFTVVSMNSLKFVWIAQEFLWIYRDLYGFHRGFRVIHYHLHGFHNSFWDSQTFCGFQNDVVRAAHDFLRVFKEFFMEKYDEVLYGQLFIIPNVQHQKLPANSVNMIIMLL
jgi:hypothetical protein